ncbi:protein FAM162A-like [Patiria miniata]|uniref:Uncharacterized protein n=1 Tax=Patiria miniata TaxID=46514 RepID=A0A914BR39_PATMI|nr:protein FAM162A-like [Patiria miniata]
MLRISRQAVAPVLRVFSRSFTSAKVPCQMQNNRVLLNLNADSAVSTHVGNASGSPVNCCGALRAYSTGKEVEKTPEPQTSGTASGTSESAAIRHREPSNMERKVFVWTGKYKTVDEVPKLVSEAALMSAKTKFRIYINLLMGAATLLAAVAMIIIGRSRAKKGESVSGLNIRRHPEMYGKMIAQEDAKK